MEQQQLFLDDGHPHAEMRALEVFEDEHRWHRLAPIEVAALESLDVILMRKDPPFDMEYIYTTYILELAEHHGSLIVNKPSSLRDINEKAYTTWFSHCTPPSLITRSQDSLKSFIAEQKEVVLKPLDGMGGQSIFLVSEGDLNTNVIIETLTAYESNFTLAQRFIPEISEGDKRILLIDGKPVEYALARIPAPGETRGNLAAGAEAEGRKLTERDRWLCSEVGPVLKKQGIIFAGLDVIGDFLTEINVTSPTGIRELDRQYGIDIAATLIEAIERKLEN